MEQRRLTQLALSLDPNLEKKLVGLAAEYGAEAAYQHFLSLHPTALDSPSPSDEVEEERASVGME